jgi:hypothetical protein
MILKFYFFLKKVFLDSSNKCNGRKKEVKILKTTARRKEKPFLLC